MRALRHAHGMEPTQIELLRPVHDQRSRDFINDVGLADPLLQHRRKGTDAAQAAWGHQRGSGGCSTIKPPCQLCAVIVAALPLDRDAESGMAEVISVPVAPGGGPPGRAGCSVASNGPLAVVGVGARMAPDGEVTE